MTDKDFLVSIGEKIRQIREGKSISQIELASIIGMDNSNLNVIENGKSNPQILTYFKICNGLNIEFKDLFSAIDIKSFNERKKNYVPRKHK
jgi:transcriptional regulator with XRE-family HTH domain